MRRLRRWPIPAALLATGCLGAAGAGAHAPRPFAPAPPNFAVASPPMARGAPRAHAADTSATPPKIPNPAFAGYLASRTGATELVARLTVPDVACTRAERAISPGAFLLTGPSDHERFDAANVILGCYKGHAVGEEALIVNDREVNYEKQLYPGDRVAVRLTVRPGATTTVELRDVTPGHRFTIARHGRGAAADSELVGDWGSIDRFTGYQVAPPSFRTITFTGASVGGTPLGATTPHAYEMATPANVLQISVGSLFGSQLGSFHSMRRRG